MKYQKNAAAIHDISGLGKCSLTAALPVLSAAGISVGVLPTAVLSTQTGGLNNYTYRDLTCDMRGIMSHWQSLNIKFDAVYSGFLGSAEQIDIVSDFLEIFRHKNCLFLCDPAMADNGKLYNTFDIRFAEMMKILCRKADILVPNMTEAAFLLDCPYVEPPYSDDFVRDIVRRLALQYKAENIVLTGVELNGSGIGVAAYNRKTDTVSFSFRPKIDGIFHSTGDLFSSALLGAMLNGFDINTSADIAIDFTVSAILKTVENGGDSRFGLAFEKCLPYYMKDLGVI